jgi:hypothetical protein
MQLSRTGVSLVNIGPQTKKLVNVFEFRVDVDES